MKEYKLTVNDRVFAWCFAFVANLIILVPVIIQWPAVWWMYPLDLLFIASNYWLFSGIIICLNSSKSDYSKKR